MKPRQHLTADLPYSKCRTADQAAAAIATSFNTYGITSPGEMAAIIATMAFESGDFKYQKNHFPGRPGQGTRNMQMASYNLKYVQSIPSLASPLAAITGTSGSVDYDNAVLGLVISSDVLDFGSGAWFLASQCSSAVRSGLQSGNQAGFEAYVRNCVQTDPTSDRLVYWKRAIAAL
ncbi:hypothetical protein MMC14_004023 [Varicellaria rhodocarpa]|nr:hypothetical protein [Varicellaria rhodocarpa]